MEYRGFSADMNESRASLYILLAIFLWSSIGIVVRLSGVEPQVLIFYACLVSLIIQGLILSREKYRKEIPEIRRLRPPVILGLVGLVNTFTYYYAFKHTTIANAVLTHYTAPVIVAFLAPVFLKERTTRDIVLALIIATAGLWLMLNGFSFAEGHAAGITAGIISGFTYAVVVILLRIYSQSYSPIVLSFFSNMVTVILLMPFIKEFPVKALWSFLVMGVVHSTISPILYFKGLRYVTANKAAVLGYLEPVSAIIFSMIFLDELPGFKSVVGGTLIILSGYLTLRGNAK